MAVNPLFHSYQIEIGNWILHLTPFEGKVHLGLRWFRGQHYSHETTISLDEFAIAVGNILDAEASAERGNAGNASNPKPSRNESLRALVDILSEPPNKTESAPSRGSYLGLRRSDVLERDPSPSTEFDPKS